MHTLHAVTLQQRTRAALLHLLLSAVVLSAAIYLIFWLWYPAPLHTAVGVTQIYLIILLADVIIGPLLTFIVYKHDKKELRTDLAVILLLQIAALLYGTYTVEQGRPTWLVFVVDDFELVSPSDLGKRNADTEHTAYPTSIWSSPQWIAAQYSSDPEIKQQQKEDEMFLGLSLAKRPETYASIEQASSAILERAKPLQALNAFNSQEQVEHTLSTWPHASAWLPLKAPEQDMVVLINTQGKPLAAVNLHPWDE